MTHLCSSVRLHVRVLWKRSTRGNTIKSVSSSGHYVAYSDPSKFIPAADGVTYSTIVAGELADDGVLTSAVDEVGGLDWIEQGLTSPPTQYRLSGRQFYRSTVGVGGRTRSSSLDSVVGSSGVSVGVAVQSSYPQEAVMSLSSSSVGDRLVND